MSQGFEDWLKSVWLEDENRKIVKKQNNELRKKLKFRLANTIADMKGREVCLCDTCVLLYLRHEDENDDHGGIERSLALVGMAYLLGENFNGASAGYYYSYYKKHNVDKGDEI